MRRQKILALSIDYYQISVDDAVIAAAHRCHLGLLSLIRDEAKLREAGNSHL